MRNPATGLENDQPGDRPEQRSASKDTAPVPAEQREQRRHVLLIGIDGARWSIAAEEGVAPNLQRMAREGQWREMTMEVPTISAPGWASILTGTTHAQHGYRDNTCVGGRNWEHPDFLAQAFYRDQRTRTFAAAGWQVLVDPAGMGPIVHTRLEQQYAGLHRVIYRDGETNGYIRTDAEIADFTLAALRAGAFDVGFMYSCDVDDTGHVYGLLGSEYRDALRRIDAHIGRLIEAAEQRHATHGEDWLIVCVTDHGHLDAGGHGGDSAEERASWITSWATSGDLPAWPECIQPHELAGLLVDAHFEA